MYQQKLSMPSFEESNKILSQEALILHLIHQNDYETLKEIGLTYLNVNYLEQYSEIEVDSKISPLICACFLGRMEIVKLLLQNESIDVDLASEESGQTPLTISALTGNYEIMKLLVEHGAEVNKPNGFNQTPFICCFARLEEEKNQFENRKICIKMAELLLHFGADINWIVDKQHGYTLLMQLCSIKMDLSQKEMDTNYYIVKFLLENGSNKELASFKNKSALDLVNKHKNKEKMQELITSTQQIYFYNHKPQLNRVISNQYPKQLQFDDDKNNKKWINYLAFCNK